MQGVANELQQAETAFLAPGEEGAFRLRWFNPVAEVALCGHATLAGAHWLWESGVLQQETTAFTTRSGRLTAFRDDDRIVLDFPAVPAAQVTPPPELLAALAGPVPVWAGVTDNADAGERKHARGPGIGRGRAPPHARSSGRHTPTGRRTDHHRPSVGLAVSCLATSRPPTGSRRTQ